MVDNILSILITSYVRNKFSEKLLEPEITRVDCLKCHTEQTSGGNSLDDSTKRGLTIFCELIIVIPRLLKDFKHK